MSHHMCSHFTYAKEKDGVHGDTLSPSLRMPANGHHCMRFRFTRTHFHPALLLCAFKKKIQTDKLFLKIPIPNDTFVTHF